MDDSVPDKIFFYGKDAEMMSREELLVSLRACVKELNAARESANRRAMCVADMMKLSAFHGNRGTRYV